MTLEVSSPSKVYEVRDLHEHLNPDCQKTVRDFALETTPVGHYDLVGAELSKITIGAMIVNPCSDHRAV